jgi:hypothetical protein
MFVEPRPEPTTVRTDLGAIGTVNLTDTAGEWARALEAGIGVLGLRGQHHP